jgi:hypothetical protein
MQLKKAVSLLGVLGAILCSIPASAQVFSDDFEGETKELNALLDNWTVSDGAVDVIGTGFFDLRPPRTTYLDLDGTMSDAGKITTNMIFAPGDYVLSFDLSGNARGFPDDSVTVSLGSYSETFTLPSSALFSTYVRNVSVLAPSQLMFDHAGGDNVGILLDNVAVHEANAAVPEPSALLYGLALAPIGLALRRRFRK